MELLPAATYCVEITDYKKDRNLKSSNEQIMFSAKVVTPKDYAGKSLVDFITITEASVWRIKAFLIACLNTNELPKVDTTSLEFDGLLNACKGRRMYWDVIIDNYNGKDKNKTHSKNPYGEYAKNHPFSADNLSDIPEWVKNNDE